MKHLMKPIFICALGISLFLGLRNMAMQDIEFERTPEAAKKWEQIEADKEDIKDRAASSWLYAEAKKDLNHTLSIVKDFLGFKNGKESSYSSGLDAIRGLDKSGDSDVAGSVAQEVLSEVVKNTKSVTVDALDEVELVYVVDGDTLMVVDSDGQEYRVRLIGIDTPESVNPDESRNNEYGKMASDYTKSLLNNAETLYLEYDKEQTDSYGRLLAYVWLSSDTENLNNMLNYRIISDGFAASMKIAPNVAHASDFEMAEQTARSNNYGLWANDGYVSLVSR